MHGIIKSESKVDSNKRRCNSITHAIISACRPRSFISQVLLSTAAYIHRRYASRELIDILNALGFSDDYREVQRFNSTFINTEPSYNLSVSLRWCSIMPTIISPPSQDMILPTPWEE